MGCHFLLQGIFPTQGSNPDLLHCRQILSYLSHQGMVYKLGVLCPFAPMLKCPPDHCPSPSFSLLPQGQRRARHQGQCCEDCVSPAGSCSHRGLVRYQDEIWKGSACEFCTCDRGQVTCQTAACARVECAQVRSEGISGLETLSPAGSVVPHLFPPVPSQQRGQPGLMAQFQVVF